MLKLSLVIGGDATGAKAAAQQTQAALTGVREDSERASAAVAAATGKVEAAAKASVVSLARVRDEMGRFTGGAASGALGSAGGANGALNAATINRSLNVADDFGAASRGVDIKAYGTELDALRAKFNPLFALQQQYKAQLAEINAAARVGAISEKERGAAIQSTKDSFAQQVTALNKTAAGNQQVAQTSGLARHEMINLSRQVQDVGVSLASGQGFGTVLIQQGTQIADVFASSTGTIGGFFKQAAAGILGFISPMALVVGGTLAIGAAGIVAASQYGDGQRQIQNALTGTGRAAGVIASDIDRIASTSASTFGLSVAEARSFATELTATGKIGRDMMQPIVAIGNDVAKVYGVDAAGAAKMLATAFADPVKGATDLNARLGFLSAGMQKQITDLQAQNRLVEAQQLLHAGVKQSVDGVNASVSTSTRFWSAIGNSISNAWDAFGRGASRLTGIGFTQGLDEQIEETRKRVESLRKALSEANPSQVTRGGRMRLVDDLSRQLSEQEAQLAKLNGAWAKYWDQVSGAQRNRDSFAVSAAVGRIAPEIDQLRSLNNDYQLFALTLEGVNRTGGENSATLKTIGLSFQELSRLVDEAKGKVDGFKSSNDRATASLQQQIGAIGKRSPQQLGQQAYDQTLLQLGSTSPQALQQADLARTLAIGQAQQQISDAARSQLLSTQQRVEASGLELSLVGRGVIEQERQRSILQAKQQLEQDALHTYGSRDAYDRKHLDALTEQLNKEAAIRGEIAAQQLGRDVNFERSQIGRTDGEQVIAGRLRSIYGDDYQGQMNGAIAGQMRLNEQLQFTHDIGQDAYKGILNDLRQGKTLGEAMGNALIGSLNRVAERLADAAWSELWGNVLGKGAGGGGGFGGVLGSLFSGLFGGGAGSAGGTGFSLTTTGGLYDKGGYTGTIGTKAVAGVVHGQEFVVKASETARHRPLLEAINAGRFPGYEAGGFVGPSSPSWASPIGGMASPAGSARPLNVIVENHAAGVTHEARQGLTEDDVRIIARQESAKQVRDQTPTVVASQIGDRNSKVSKALTAHTGAGRRLAG